MSTKVMAQCWPIVTDAASKAVLVSLADQANDEGICWPSVGTIATRTCLAERTVQRAIQGLQDDGHLTVQIRSGRSTIYRIHPRHSDTPVTVTPPSQRHPTPVTVTPHPRHSDTQNRKGTVREPMQPAADAAHSGAPEPDDPIADSPRHGDAPVDVDKVLFDAGIGLLAESRGPQQARAIVGRLRKNLGADEALRLIVDARGTTDPAAYLMAAEKRHVVAAKIRAETGKPVKHLPDGRYYAYPHFYSAEGRREVHV